MCNGEDTWGKGEGWAITFFLVLRKIHCRTVGAGVKRAISGGGGMERVKNLPKNGKNTCEEIELYCFFFIIINAV